MSTYNAPLKDTAFVLNELVGFDSLCETLGLEEVNSELAGVVVEEAGKLASEVLAPLNWTGDQNGAKLSESGVQESPGFAEAYQQYVENGWGTLTAPEEFGGQALPNCLGTAVNELWHSANMAFALCPMLGQGAVEALIAHGSDELKQRYLPRLISGEWTGTMNLTEPSAGSDLAAVSSKAVPNGDHYLISGQKIFITWGDHQMTPNIIHLVLARLPDAPAGVKGISLFIVPKFLLDEAGEPSDTLNDVKCISLEHKLGIHGSPTCTMSFGDEGGAIGYLVGEANKGLAYMFTMMNHARQSVGVQGLSISERAYQQAVVYAKERLQGSRRDGSKMPIIEHPDVRRMLMAMRSGTEAMRALALMAAAATDKAEADHSKMPRVELYTPIVKGWMTELAQEITSLNVQVHGGMGYVEETGAAQHFRDARILPIYEGTNAIQALDLIGRKTLVDSGAEIGALLAEIKADIELLNGSSNPGLIQIGASLSVALESAEQSVAQILEQGAKDRAFVGVVAFDYLMLMGYLVGGWLLAKGALAAETIKAAENTYGDAFLSAKQTTAGFYAQHYLPRVAQHGATLKTGLTQALTLPEELF